MPFLLIVAGTFASEDLTCLATGALVAQGRIGFFEGTLACFTGILAGDIFLFLGGRLGGWGLARVPQAKLDRAKAWLARRGVVVVLISRFVPSLRVPTYVAAGLLRADFWRFTAHFAIAAALWTPLIVGGSAFLWPR